MQGENIMLQKRRYSRSSLRETRRSNTLNDADLQGPRGLSSPNDERIPSPPPYQPPDPPMTSMGGGYMAGSNHTMTLRRSSLRSSSDKYSQGARNIHTPLNNEDRSDRSLMPGRRPDLTYINNTSITPSQSLYKNNNALANQSIPPSREVIVMSHHHQASRRASEPPRPLGRGVLYQRGRSFDEFLPNDPLGHEYLDSDENESRDGASYRAQLRREAEEREAIRTISRAHLRRDSFGEVTSRRSPSQDSLDFNKSRMSPHIDDLSQPGDYDRGYSRHSPGQDSWSNTPSSRRTGSQDSIDQQVRTPLFKLFEFRAEI